MKVGLLDHVNIQTTDLEKSCWFYETILGMKVGWRPDFPFPGAWLYVDSRPVVHLIGRDPDDPDAPARNSGTIDHVAFAGQGFLELVKRIEREAIPYDVRDVPGLQQRQLFMRDPNNVKVEIVLTGPDATAGKAKYPVYTI
jgi:catechol 2,3-dioxygenase-like lactoylglutathione lyase family enzyme